MKIDGKAVLQFAQESADRQSEESLEAMAGLPAETGLTVCGCAVDFECLSAYDLAEFKRTFKVSLMRMGKVLRDIDNLPENLDPMEVIGFLIVRMVQQQNPELTTDDILKDLTIRKLRTFGESLADVVDEKKSWGKLV